jgi:hypothetical protein
MHVKTASVKTLSLFLVAFGNPFMRPLATFRNPFRDWISSLRGKLAGISKLFHRSSCEILINVSQE